MRAKKAKRQESQTSKFNIRFGILKKLLLGLLAPLMAVLILVGLMLNQDVDNVVLTVNNEYLNAEASAAVQTLNAQFQRYLGMTDAIAQSDEMQKKITGWTANFGGTTKKSDIMTTLTRLKNMDSSIVSTWAYSMGARELYQSDNTHMTAATFDATGREWYRAATEQAPIITGAYEDVTSGELIVSFATPIKANGTVIGVMGSDVLLDTFTAGISQVKVGETGYITVFDQNNNVVYHPDESLLLANVSEIDYSEDIKQVIESNQIVEAMEYTRSGETYHASSLALDSGYFILGLMPDAEYQQYIVSTTRTIIIWFAAALLFLGALIAVISWRLVQSIRKLSAVTEKIAMGELDTEAEITTKDEIGLVASDVNAVVERLKQYILYIDEITAVLTQMGKGDFVFTLQQDYAGEFAKVKRALLEAQGTISDALKSVVVAADQVASGADQVAIGAQTQAQGATEQASSVQELASNLQELSHWISGSTDLIMQTGQALDGAGRDVHEGEEKMQAMLQAMDAISTNSEQVANIIKSIEDIAFQTNILALNAAVEAARAGSAGKGFAVVADEVRSLAGKTSEASKTTAELIQKALDAVKQGKAIAQETAASFEKVYHSIGDINTNAHQITENSAKQDEAIQQTTQGVDQISGVVQNNSATAEESAAASEELSSQAQMLKDLVANFHLPDDHHSPSAYVPEHDRQPTVPLQKPDAFDKY